MDRLLPARRSSRDLRVVVIEREIAGFGPVGAQRRLGGRGPRRQRRRRSASPATATGAARALRATFAAVDEIGEVAAREQIDCGYRKAGALTVATSDAAMAAPARRARRTAGGDGATDGAC